MIGYYVHHQGRGHLHRALAVARELDEPLTVLSSLPRPAGCSVDWVLLDRDDEGGSPCDPTAGDRLHWAPRGDPGLRRRTHQISAWLEAARPRLLVVDVSVEVTLLARLHGVPVVGVVLPGRRDDPAHRLGFDVCTELVAAWPPSVTASALPGLPSRVVDRVHAVGGLARVPVHRPGPRRPGPPRVVLLGGQGGSDLSATALDEAMRSAPDWQWVVCGPLGQWSDDPQRHVRDADVVVTHAGQNAVAEVAAARRPAVVVPESRPFEEQATTAATLRAGPWPALVLDRFPRDGWGARLRDAAALDGSRWDAWCDGEAARRFAAVLAQPAVGARVA